MSSCHSTEPDGPDSASVAVSVTLRPLPTVAGTVVVSAGLTESMRIVSSRQADVLPAMSLTRVERVWTPSPLTYAFVAARLPLDGAPPSTFHSSEATPEFTSVPLSLTP